MTKLQSGSLALQISAKKGDGIDELLETVLLVAELEQLQANPDRSARGMKSTSLSPCRSLAPHRNSSDDSCRHRQACVRLLPVSQSQMRSGVDGNVLAGCLCTTYSGNSLSLK